MGHVKDPTARHFVYYLHDGSGEIAYVGRSKNVAGRIQQHYHHAATGDSRYPGKAAWLFAVRSVSMRGPMTWERAIEMERAEIGRLQPRGNVKLTKRDPWIKANRERVSA